jgi:uncharacterized circularly permuted ATP-grasp superfamily protein/uncharacterized alpha-E superfamily protein
MSVFAHFQVAYCKTVKISTDDYFATFPMPDEIIAAASACRASAGHYDELRGTVSRAEPSPLAAPWSQFFAHMDARNGTELDARSTSLQQQIRDNGVTYNVYADDKGPQRPWSLDLFPLIIDHQDWNTIEKGILQRVQLLESIMTDCYGAQNFLRNNLLPPALMYGHPGYLRALHGMTPAGGVHLHVVAFDLARGPFGDWWILEQRCEAPSGLGYLLENRLAIARQFAPAFQSLKVQRLAGTYRALMDSLKRFSPAGRQSHVALLTPGPYNETYFEHAYLARYLGISLVEGSDLVVRDDHLYLKTMRGLMPVHCLLKRVDDPYLDPLELRSDSTLGVPGLLQAIRAGNVLMANAPGTGFLESPALMGFLPALAKHVLQQELLLPALPSWWCGEHSAMQEVLPHLQQRSIKSTYPHSNMHTAFDPVQGQHLSAAELKKWAEQIRQHSDSHTVQAHVPLSQMPTWQSGSATAAGRLVPRSCLLRVFAVSDGHDPNGQPRWRVLPGGLARLAGTSSANLTSMQRGGSSADVWALTQDTVDTTSLLPGELTPDEVIHRQRLVTSRSAENLFWLGRYTERTENSVRLTRLILECLNGEARISASLMQWLSAMAVRNSLITPTESDTLQNRKTFALGLLQGLGCNASATGVGFNLRALKSTAAQVRERLSQEHWNMIVSTENDFIQRCQEAPPNPEIAIDHALRTLQSLNERMAAITGAQSDRMTRDDGWRLLSIGRHIERLSFLSQALSSNFQYGGLHSPGSFDAILTLFDSIITYRAQFQQSRNLTALLDLLVLDTDNPRSLAWVLDKLRSRLAKISTDFAPLLPCMAQWNLTMLCQMEPPHRPAILLDLLQQLNDCACKLSDALSATYFTHARVNKFSVRS